MRRLLAIPLVLALIFGATSCFEFEFAPGEIVDVSVKYYAPGNDNTTDWLWIYVSPESMEALHDATGSELVTADVCFGPAPTIYGRPYLDGIFPYGNTTSSGCTAVVRLAEFNSPGPYSYGWRKMAVFSPGEDITVRIRIFSNDAQQTIPFGIAGRIANDSQTIIWEDFGATPPEGTP